MLAKLMLLNPDAQRYILFSTDVMQWMAQASACIVTMCKRLTYTQLVESCAMMHGKTAAAESGHTNTVCEAMLT